MTRGWPWGLAVVTDPASSEEVPTALNQNGIAAGRTILAARIQHAVDGEAIAEVRLGRCSEDLTCLFDGTFVTVSEAVILGDAAYESHQPAEVGPGPHRLRVLVDEPGSPTRVIFEFSVDE